MKYIFFAVSLILITQNLLGYKISNIDFINAVPATCAKNDDCGQYYYCDLNTHKCVNCIDHCIICNNDNQCTVCDNGFYRTQQLTCDKCIDNCELCKKKELCEHCNAEYYYVESSNTCKSCTVENCHECSKAGDCQLCKEDYFKKVIGQVVTCEPCMSHCEVCSDDKTCQYCHKGYIYVDELTQCVICNKDFIHPGYFYDKDANICGKCIENCDTCTTINNCLICKDNYYEMGLNKCYSCLDNIKQCSKTECDLTSEQCIECINYPSKENCETCYKQCEKCFEKSILNQCVKIALPDYCNKAQQCNDDYKFYCDFDSHKCKECIINCDVCLSGDNCVHCRDFFFPQDNGCKLCLPNCRTCNSENTCQKCIDGKFFKDTSCQDCGSNCKECTNEKICKICYDKYYKNKIDDSNIVCAKCYDNCEICENNKSCEVCSKYYTKIDYLNQCIKCDDNFKVEGYYYDKASKNCFKCFNFCDECNSSTECTKCAELYFSSQNQNKVKCEACVNKIINCSKCDIQLEICVSCIQNPSLSNCKDCFDQCSQCFDKDSCNNQCFIDTNYSWDNNLCQDKLNSVNLSASIALIALSAVILLVN